MAFPVWTIGYVLVTIIFPQLRGNSLLKNGEVRNGMILEVWDTGVTINNIYPVIGLRIAVEDGSSVGYEATTEKMISRLDVARVQPGVAVTLRVDRSNPKRIAVEEFQA